jgi:N utilization substance protein B
LKTEFEMAQRQKTYQARSAARRKALQMLYQAQIIAVPAPDVVTRELYVEELGLPCDFTCMLLNGVSAHLAEIDALIAETSEHWSIERMPLVDLNILRLAAFEMLHVSDVPHSVSINEAVELAKDYGGEDLSSKFVNGVLGKIALKLSEKAEQEEAGAEHG